MIKMLKSFCLHCRVMITVQKPKFEMHTLIEQKFELPLAQGTEPHTIYGRYVLDTERHEESLEIGVPGIEVPGGYRGLHATFSKWFAFGKSEVSGKDIEDLYTTDIRNRGYWHQPELESVFREFIQPILEANIPKNMLKLIRYDDKTRLASEKT